MKTKKIKKTKELYGVVQFINGNPILDGMPYFENKEDALAHAAILKGSHEMLNMSNNFSCNIIRLYPGERTLSELLKD